MDQETCPGDGFPAERVQRTNAEDLAASNWRHRVSGGYPCARRPEVGPTIQLTNLWAHAGRKLFEGARNSTAPFAEDGIKRIAGLYKIEAEIKGLAPDARLAIRQDRARPKIAGLKAWLTHHRTRPSAKSPSGEALKYIAKYWTGLCRSRCWCENWATIAARVETCNLTPSSLTATFTAIVNGHKQSRFDDLLPWNYAAKV